MTESINDKPEIYIEFSAAQDEFVILTTRGSRLVTNQKFPSVKSATDWATQEGYKIYAPVPKVREAMNALNEEPSVDTGIPEAGINFDAYGPATTAVPWREAIEPASSGDPSISVKKGQESLNIDMFLKFNEELRMATIEAARSLIKIFEEGGFARRVSEDQASPGHVLCMLDTLVSKANTMPLDKMNRWLGFAQAIAVKEQLTTVIELRDMTRPIFSTVYDTWLKGELEQLTPDDEDFFNSWTVNAQAKTIETKED